MLEITWFVLWVLLWAIYLVLDGADFGTGILAPFLAKTPQEKRDTYLAVGPFWDGNEVWLIAAGGVTFAAFPKAYAVLFSAMYAPLLIFLFVLIFRATAIEFQLHMTHPTWKAVWEKIYWGSNALAPLLLGVFFANLFTGIPIDENGVYHGSLLGLFTPYTCLTAALFLVLFCMHGSIWLAIKTDGDLKTRAIRLARILWPITGITLFLFLWKSYCTTSIYIAYRENLGLMLVPTVLILAILGIGFFLKKELSLWTWVLSALTILTLLFWGMLGIFPNMILSSLSPDFSIGIFEAASSPLTLKIMLGVALVFVPIVIVYQIWAHSLFFKTRNM